MADKKNTNQKLVTAKELCEIIGLTAGTISRARKLSFPNGNVGTMIDINHPDVKLYITEQKAKLERKANNGKVPQTTIKTIDTLDKYGDMKLDDILDEFGSASQFIDWLTALSKIVSIQEKNLKNSKTLNDLVSITVLNEIINTFDTGNRKLLQDGSRAIAARLQHMMSDDHQNPLVTSAIISKELSNIIEPMLLKASNELLKLQKTKFKEKV